MQTIGLHSIPHRFPMLLVDRVLISEQDAGQTKVTGIKNVTHNEDFFRTGNTRRDMVIMPGILVVEAMAQTAIFSLQHTCGKKERALLLAGFRDVSYRDCVRPGDQIIMSGELEKQQRSFGFFSCKASVGDTIVAKAYFIASFA